MQNRWNFLKTGFYEGINLGSCCHTFVCRDVCWWLCSRDGGNMRVEAGYTERSWLSAVTLVQLWPRTFSPGGSPDDRTCGPSRHPPVDHEVCVGGARHPQSGSAGRQTGLASRLPYEGRVELERCSPRTNSHPRVARPSLVLRCPLRRFIILVPRTSESPQPHLEDSSVYRQKRPTQLDKIKNLRVAVQFSLVAERAVCTHMPRFVSLTATRKNWPVICASAA